MKGVAIHATGIIVITLILLLVVFVVFEGWKLLHTAQVSFASCMSALNTFCSKWEASKYTEEVKPISIWKTLGLACSGQIDTYRPEGPTDDECRQFLEGRKSE